MNSKFTPIAKVRKQQRDKVETLLAKERYKKSELEKKILDTRREIEEMKSPKEGSISLISVFREHLAILRREKDNLQEAMLKSESEIMRLQSEYKQANTEYEKIKYLEEQDFEEWMEKIKKQEQLDMDEISNILFNNKE
ncbi:flagellar export protein FliJ [Sulfurospirillum arcachonense]|uniref:flagellar export protein FliJ n=1 Tax=Sulfurospirillum arcachonense TaxID=57666 RepID=UPI000468F36C|nr:flagellar export protein FliJ [Sulfurospirillum arcachonense]